MHCTKRAKPSCTKSSFIPGHSSSTGCQREVQLLSLLQTPWCRGARGVAGSLKASRDEALLEMTAVHSGKGMKMKADRQPAEKG